MRGAPWGHCCSWSCQSLIHMHSLGKMQNINSMLSRITAEMPFSGEPEHPPALVEQLRGQQHSGAALWAESASKCERYFPSNSKGVSSSHSLGKIQKQIWRWFRCAATESDALCFILKQSTEIYTSTNQQTFWRRCSIGLTVTHWFAAAQQYVNISIGAQLLPALLRFKLKLKATFKYPACYGNIYAVLDAWNPWESVFVVECIRKNCPEIWLL